MAGTAVAMVGLEVPGCRHRSGACRAAHALHDDRRSIAVRGRRRCTLGAMFRWLGAMFLGARRRGCRRRKDNNGEGEGRHSG